MPLELPNLDDRTYDDLIAEALRLIPTHAPDWTNHNPSDPGIMLIELFAYLTEMQLYRLNRITDENIISFLKLLNGPSWQPSGTDPEKLAKNLQETIAKLRKTERAVSRENFESLAKEADNRVARAYCIPRRDLRMNFDTEMAGYVGLVIIPTPGLLESELREVLGKVKSDLESRRLLTTRLQVVGPQLLQIKVELTVVPLPDIMEDKLKATVEESLKTFFDPWVGGQDGKGWIFGRSIFVSEIHELVEQIPGVDSVNEKVDLNRIKTDVPDRRIEARYSDGNTVLVGLELKPYELVDAKEITVKTARPRD